MLLSQPKVGHSSIRGDPDHPQKQYQHAPDQAKLVEFWFFPAPRSMLGSQHLVLLKQALIILLPTIPLMQLSLAIHCPWSAHQSIFIRQFRVRVKVHVSV